LESTFTLWRLDLDSELIFTGDAGTTEASRPSRREGIEWANYWTPAKWLLVDADLSLSRARFRDVDPAGSYVPGAIEQAVSVGASMQGSGPWSGGVRLRHFGGRPLIEDNSVRSPASTLVNLSLAYRSSSRLQVRMDVLNLFGRKVSDIDYYYASRLRGEAGPVNDIHTHPAEPRTIRVTVRASL
jgi:outer membrane receptor protein involved in Fe transport